MFGFKNNKSEELKNEIEGLKRELKEVKAMKNKMEEDYKEISFPEKKASPPRFFLIQLEEGSQPTQDTSERFFQARRQMRFRGNFALPRSQDR